MCGCERKVAYLIPRLWWIIGLALVVVCPPAAFADSTEAAGIVDVRGIEIFRDGRPWVAKGVVIVGRVAPVSVLQGPRDARRIARDRFGLAELQDIREFGADLVRFQVSQAGSDPASPLYSAEYVREVADAVQLARRNGFSVIVSLQAQIPSGVDERGMPGVKAQRAWRELAPLFAHDRGVMLELFNEPAPVGPDAVWPHDWGAWSRAMQPLIDQIRGIKASNVLLVDGLFWAHQLDGAPKLSDPLAKIVFAVHPYYNRALHTRAAWDSAFGNFSDSHPVMITEWNAVSFLSNCHSDISIYATEMLKYIEAKKLGLVAWAFDYPGAIFDDSGRLTAFNYAHCGKYTQYGAGSLIRDYFKK